MKGTIFIFISVVLLATACTPNSLIDTYHDIPVEGWKYENTFTDSFTIEKPNHYHQIFANLRINGDYPYANIHLQLTIQKPDSTIEKIVVPVELADVSGKWLGTGLGDVITFQSPILHRKYLNQKGKYTVTIEQNMRLEVLPSVLSAGIRVEQQEEIF